MKHKKELASHVPNWEACFKMRQVGLLNAMKENDHDKALEQVEKLVKLVAEAKYWLLNAKGD